MQVFRRKSAILIVYRGASDLEFKYGLWPSQGLKVTQLSLFSWAGATDRSRRGTGDGSVQSSNNSSNSCGFQVLLHCAFPPSPPISAIMQVAVAVPVAETKRLSVAIGRSVAETVNVW